MSPVCALWRPPSSSTPTGLPPLEERTTGRQRSRWRGLSQFNTPFEDMKVNAYLVWDPDSKKAVAFDTGADCDPMLEAIDAHGLRARTHLAHSCPR